MKPSILSRIKENDEHAFEQVYKEYYSRLYYYVYGYVKDDEATKELLQLAFIALWNSRKELKEDTRIIAWLFTVVRNQCLNYLRDRKNQIRFQGDVGRHEQERLYWQERALLSSIPESLTMSELQRLIEEAVLVMPEQCGRVFSMSRFQGLSHKEIALQLNIAEKTVENQITKALKILRNKLGQDGYFLFMLLF